jgi:antitoxin CptB
MAALDPANHVPTRPPASEAYCAFLRRPLKRNRVDDRIKRGHGGFGACGIHDSKKAPMFGSTLTSAALDERRRRILFRAWRRGLREMDLVMGQFADANLPAMGEAELDEFERLLEIPDPQILAWITGSEPIPPNHDTALFAHLCSAPREALARAQGAR